MEVYCFNNCPAPHKGEVLAVGEGRTIARNKVDIGVWVPHLLNMVRYSYASP